VQATDSDLDERIDLIIELANNHFDRRLARDLDLDIQTVLQVEKSARSLYAQARTTLRGPDDLGLKADFQSQLRSEPTDVPLARAYLPGYIDRVAQLRGNGRELVLQSGSQATLSPQSGVTSPLFLALSMDAPGGRARKPVVRIAARLDPDWLFDLEGDWVSATDEVYFDGKRERVESVSRLCFGKLVLDESKREASPGPECTQILADALIAKGSAFFDPDGKLSQHLARLQLLLKTRPELQDKLTSNDRDRLDDSAEFERELQVQAVRAAASCASSLAQVLQQDLISHLNEILPPDISQAMHRDTPSSVRLGGGLTVEIHYEKDRPPWIEARLQNFFSMTETPRICAGRVALQIHLLSPNHRAVQVTSDLAGFWERHYPDLRKQLMRRYPKHLWPEDGRTASAPSPGRIR
jgi:ATP-dependent helicase HrpB